MLTGIPSDVSLSIGISGFPVSSQSTQFKDVVVVVGFPRVVDVVVVVLSDVDLVDVVVVVVVVVASMELL